VSTTHNPGGSNADITGIARRANRKEHGKERRWKLRQELSRELRGKCGMVLSKASPIWLLFDLLVRLFH
jgi:hypothetical protein